MASYPFKLITEGGTVYDGEVTALVAPGSEGSLGVLANHAPMVCATAKGWAKVTLDGGQEQFFLVHEGILEVRPDQVVWLADYAEPAASLEAACEALKSE